MLVALDEPMIHGQLLDAVASRNDILPSALFVSEQITKPTPRTLPALADERLVYLPDVHSMPIQTDGLRNFTKEHHVV